MNWRKRKRLRRIAQHYGYTHYWEYKRNLKFCIYYTAFQNALDNGEIQWSEVLPKMNQMFCKAGLPEYCMTQEEWYAKVMESVNERERQQDEVIFQFIDDDFMSPSMKVNKHANIVVKNNFHKKLEDAVSEMCDRDKPVQLGYIDYLGIEKLNGPIKEFHEAVCECLRDPNPISEYHGIVEEVTDNESSSEEET